MDWIASAAFGLEGLAAEECRRLGAKNVKPLDTGGVRFAADAKQALSMNLWLRTADRVLLIVAEGAATSFEELYQLARSAQWEKLLPRNACFPVRAHCARSQLMSPSDCQSIVKKAVADRLSKAYRLEWLPETGAEYQIDVSVRRDTVLICLDSSGDALNRRGYRTWTGEAPLRETLAAALIAVSPWRPGLAFWDPMCGTGTIAIEAALSAYNRAPGLKRAFAMEKWDWIAAEDARKIRADAEDRYQESLENEYEIGGSDVDPAPLELARRHVSQADLNGRVAIEERNARDFSPDAERGVIVVNPPYGERLGDQKTARQAAAVLGGIWRARPGWTICALSADSGFEKAFGRRADKRRRFYNGRLECEFLQFTCRNLTVSRNGGTRT